MNAGVLFVFLAVGWAQAVMDQTDKTTADRITEFGYDPESHSLTTEDGYILTLFRITKPGSPISDSWPRPVVLMMHGLLSSSDCWILNGPKDALAFNLVDSGYDVWLGNCRGTPYSYRHVSLDPNQKRFWHFTINELGTVDLPNIIDYILRRTRQPRLHYVGHSQGTTILLILLSTQPQYNDKIKTGHLMAPVAFMSNARAPLIKLLSPLFRFYTPLNNLIGDRPLMQSQLEANLLGIIYCRQQNANVDECSHLLFEIAGGYSSYFNRSLLPAVYNTHPASCSIHQLIHLIQLYTSGYFHPYNYGVKGNLQRYGQPVPPSYNLSNIQTGNPLHLYYSDYDEFSSKTDVEYLSRILGNRSVRHFIDRRYFAHVDFIWATIVRKEINQVVLNIMYDAEVWC